MEEWEENSEEFKNKQIKFEADSIFLDDLFDGSRKICDKMIRDTRLHCDMQIARADKYEKWTKYFAWANLFGGGYWLTRILLESLGTK